MRNAGAMKIWIVL